MATAPRCPVCNTPHHLGEAKPGTMLICEKCKEVFDAAEERALELDDEPKANDKPRRRRDDDRDDPRGNPRKKSAKRREDNSGDEPRRSDRDTKKRNAMPILLLLLGLGFFGFLAFAVTGGAAWYFVRKADQEAQVRVEAAERDAEVARRNEAEMQRQRVEMEQTAREARERAAKEVADLLRDKPIINDAPPPRDKLPVEVPVIKPVVAPGLREVRAVALPPLDVKPVPPVIEPLPKAPKLPNTQRYIPPADFFKVIHAPKHDLLFVLTPKSVWIYDLKANKEVGRQEANQTFTDISLAPDQSAVFVADHGGPRVTVNGDPPLPSHVQRFDTATRKWDTRKVPKVAWKIEAADANRVLLLESSTYADLTLNKWDDGANLNELARVPRSEYYGDIEYDHRTGRVFHGNMYLVSHRIKSYALEGDRLTQTEFTGTAGAGTAQKDGGGSVVLSRDGSRLYYGRLQVKADAIKDNVQVFPEIIVAASRGIAFGTKTYYNASTGAKIGEFEFKIATIGTLAYPLESGSPPVIHVSPDGQSVWVIDRDKNALRQFTVEGEK